ncbi:Lsr2 family DNA-binding protein [Streptomyces ficellus]|uniref:Uncharacterized protein n=1 Tax=Streptomyces ficellus TaxID=1977088 RepID=A0A6I6FGB2_9ACTN|nr:restriction endonuclease [Streptomyces ficellus]QGV77539.1 hypothetical protein EIZ62_04205 [Streptomyces ficellus]
MSSLRQAEPDGYPVPLPWLARASSAPHVPGGPAEIIGNLTALLRDIAADPTVDRPFGWPTGDRPTTLRKALHLLGTCGLLVRQSRPARVTLTEEAERFLAAGDPLHLLSVLHAHVRFMGEALAAVGDGLSHDELNGAALRDYGLKWDSLDQVRRRVYWLRAAGVVDYWSNGRILLNERGRRFLERLELADAEQLPHRRPSSPQPPELPPTPAPLASGLEEAGQDALRSRKRLVGYIAGGVRVDALARLVNAAVPSIDRGDFLDFCVGEFGVRESSADQTLGTLKALGLVGQVGTDAFAATDLAASCLASGEPLDFVRLLHLRVALLGETLDALADETDTGTLVHVLAERYPDARLTRDDVTRRVALFLETGLAERIGQIVRRTELGAALVRTLPLLAREDMGPGALPGPRGQADGVAGSPSPAGADRTVRPDPAERAAEVAAEVVRAATDSADYERFERAVAAAFRTLGVEVEEHSGPKKTDVVVELWQSPVSRLRVAVEAKTDGAGLVTDDDVRFVRLRQHRERHRARSTVLVGPRFDARVEEEAAKDGVALLTARELADAVVRHGRTPLAPREIAALVSVGERPAWERTCERAERRQEALVHVLDTLWKSGNDPVDIEYSAGALGVRDIWRETKAVLETPLDPAEIEEALAFLGTPLVGGVVRQGADHVVTGPPALVAARLRALASAIESTGRGPTAPAAVDPARRLPGKEEPPAAETPGGVTPSAVRAWAAAQGRAVSARGRLPVGLVREYQRAHGLVDG